MQAERACMRKWLFVMGLTACTGQGLLPTLSVHAVTQLEQRTKTAERRSGRDVAVSVQLAFATSRRNPRSQRLGSELPWQPSAAADDVECEHAALCEWAWLAEESTLAALGLQP
jgi:hypothetical protein